MSKAAAAAIIFATITCILGITLVYVLLPTTPNVACWRKTYTPIYDVTGNETWDYFTTTIITDQVATVTVNFSAYISHGGGADHCNLSLRWDGISYWNYQSTISGTRSNLSQFTFPAGTYTLTLSLAEDFDSSLENTFLEVCVTYS